MTERRRALVTGVTGQDGSYLRELLQEKGYEVHGFVRRGQERLAGPGVQVHVGDLADPASLRRAVVESWPHEIYNLGAQSHVGASFLEPTHTFQVTALPIIAILEQVRSKRDCRVYQASSSEMFGVAPPPQNEGSQFVPQSPYAVAKIAAHHAVGVYRKAYGLFAVSGILMNHESPRRPEAFVTRKVTRAIARIFAGKQSALELGNLEAVRDWGHARDYVRAMWMMLQADEPRDYVVATGEAHSVREFVDEAFAWANVITGQYRSWQEYVRHDDRHERPADVWHLRGDSSRIRTVLGWQPEIDFRGLVREMVEHDLELERLENPREEVA